MAAAAREPATRNNNNFTGRKRSISPQSDYACTSDPSTVNARIFIGGLNPQITSEMLKKRFSQYGELKGVTLSKNNFGFIQFTNEADCTMCLTDGPKINVEGHIIEVRQAKLNPSDKEGGGKGGKKRERDGGWEDRRERGPPSGRDTYDAYQRENNGRGGDDHYNRPREDHYSNYNNGAGYHDRPYAPTPRDFPPAPPALAPVAPPYEQPPPSNAEKLNDIEIIVPNKQQRLYAESIESQLKRMGMQVDILFPPMEVGIGRVLADLAARRVLYAVSVTDDNETHRSLTLNILYGTPQEHRNMPVDDALSLVARDHVQYKAGGAPLARQAPAPHQPLPAPPRPTHVKAASPPPARTSRVNPPPHHVRNLLLDVTDGRTLTHAEYGTLVAFLRDRQSFTEPDRGYASPLPPKPIDHYAAKPSQGAVYQRELSPHKPVMYPGHTYAAAAPVYAEPSSRAYGAAPEPQRQEPLADVTRYPPPAQLVPPPVPAPLMPVGPPPVSAPVTEPLYSTYTGGWN